MTVDSKLLDTIFHDQLEKPRDIVGLPARLVAPHLKTLQSGGLFPKKVTGIIGNIRYPLYIFPVSGKRFAKNEKATLEAINERRLESFKSLLSTFYGSHDMSYYKVHTAFLLGKKADLVPVVVPAMGWVQVFDKVREADEYVQQIAAVDAYKAILRDFSALTNLKVCFRADSTGIVAPVEHTSKLTNNLVDIYCASVPPGEIAVNSWVSRVYGHWIQETGTSTLCSQPTPGRGLVVKDPAKVPVVQVIGNNWYLLIPVITHYNISSSEKIFTAILDGALTTWLAQQAKPAPKKLRSVSRKDFEKKLKYWHDATPVVYREMIATTRLEIKSKYDEIALLEQHCLRAEAVAQGYERSDHYKNFAKHCRGYYRALLTMPEVDRVVLDPNGIQVWTKTLYAVHDEVRYELGEYVIRLSMSGTLSIWCERSAHPESEPHPHYPSNATPCFGNAGEVIRKSAIEMRIVDATKYALRWLTQGYTEANALRYITEWPVVSENDESPTQAPVIVQPVQEVSP